MHVTSRSRGPDEAIKSKNYPPTETTTKNTTIDHEKFSSDFTL